MLLLQDYNPLPYRNKPTILILLGEAPISLKEWEAWEHE